MGIHRRPTGGLGEGVTQCCRRLTDASKLGSIDPAENGPEQLVAERVDLLEHLLALRRDLDEDDTAVFWDARPLDEAALLDPVDEAGGIRQRHVEHLGEAAHRHLPVPLERVEDVELRHAETQPDDTLTRRAFQHRHRRTEVGDDGGIRVGGGGSGGSFRARDGRVAGDSFCHVNYPTRANHRVNMNDQCRTQELRCDTP